MAGGDGVVLVQDARRIADGNADVLTRVGKIGFPGGRAWLGREQAHKAGVVQGEDLVFRRLSQKQRLQFLELVGILG